MGESCDDGIGELCSMVFVESFAILVGKSGDEGLLHLVVEVGDANTSSRPICVLSASIGDVRAWK
jgi:hypothetical protein